MSAFCTPITLMIRLVLAPDKEKTVRRGAEGFGVVAKTYGIG